MDTKQGKQKALQLERESLEAVLKGAEEGNERLKTQKSSKRNVTATVEV